MEKLNLNVSYQVEVSKQTAKYDCWARAFTMLYSWKNQISISTISVLEKYGQEFVEIFKKSEIVGIYPSEEESLYKIAGLITKKGFNPQIIGWYDLLKNHGPLSITVDSDPPFLQFHALILTGISGDGSPENTKILYIDPNGGIVGELNFNDFIKLYEGSASWPNQIIHYP